MEIKIIHSSSNLFLATSRGLVKKINEDKLDSRRLSRSIRVCLCDGHWGNWAAIFAKNKILNSKRFPSNKNHALALIENIQKSLFKKFGQRNMDENKDLTPETSILGLEINDQRQVSIISYGDCRLIITHQGRVKYKLKTKTTWLGAFSFLGLRKRFPVSKATFFKRISCVPGDLIWLFTDGVDECRYEKPTIPITWLANLGSKIIDLNSLGSEIFKEIEQHGAEDNASIVIIRC